MSAAQSESTPDTKLEDLQCHFTWDLTDEQSWLHGLRDKLEDIGSELGIFWLGHIHNLQGHLHYQLGSNEDAKRFFSMATEGLRQAREAEEGPWLVVNYGNLAWLHHHLGEEAESQAYLSKVHNLLQQYPSPSQDELHPEIYAEKALTFMKFGEKRKRLAVEYFEKAIKMQPDMVEWQTSHAVALVSLHKHNREPLEADVEEKIRMAVEQDPENLYIAVRYLHQRGKRGEEIEEEAREMATRILNSPVSSYSSLKALLRVYEAFLSADEAIGLAEEALRNHPDERFLKRCAALCYYWKIVIKRETGCNQRLIDRAVTLHEEVISLYPQSSFGKKIYLANIYAKSKDGLAKSEEIYQELLEADLNLEDQQALYYYYACHLFYDIKDRNRSTDYHMKAAEIPEQTYFRRRSIQHLEKFVETGNNRRCREVKEFLNNLQDKQQTYFRRRSIEYLEYFQI